MALGDHLCSVSHIQFQGDKQEKILKDGHRCLVHGVWEEPSAAREQRVGGLVPGRIISPQLPTPTHRGNGICGSRIFLHLLVWCPFVSIKLRPDIGNNKEIGTNGRLTTPSQSIGRSLGHSVNFYFYLCSFLKASASEALL